MRVLLTTDTVGGVWTFSKETTLGLLQRGHAVALVSFGREPSLSQQRWISHVCHTYGSAFFYQPSDLPLEWMQANHDAYTGAESILLRTADDFKADLIHANQFCFGALPTAIPRIITAHSDVLSWAATCKGGSLEHSDWLHQYRTLVTAGLSGADRIVAPTRWMMEALSANFGISVPRAVIYNGRTPPISPARTPRHLQAVTVGRLWDEAKGLNILNEVRLCMPVLVVGENSFEAAQAPALQGVELLGSLDEAAVMQTFERSSLYLATSIYEPFGLAPLEAAQRGCGILARDLPSFREVWGNAAEYFSDAHSLSVLLSRLNDSPRQLAALQDRSHQRALEFSADRMVNDYLALFDSLLPAANAREEVAVYAR